MTAGLPERVRTLREWSGKSQRMLAELAGLGESHVRLIELGERVAPSVETLAKLADLCGVELGWLATGAGRAPTQKSVAASVARRAAAAAAPAAEPSEGAA